MVLEHNFKVRTCKSTRPDLNKKSNQKGMQQCECQQIFLCVLKEADAFDMSLWKPHAIDPKEWANIVKHLKTLGLGTLMNKAVGS